jgi:hypothetical protein
MDYRLNKYALMVLFWLLSGPDQISTSVKVGNSAIVKLTRTLVLIWPFTPVEVPALIAA